MKHLIAASIITAVLSFNFAVALVLGITTSNLAVILGQGIWLLPSALWLNWAIKRRSRRGNGPEPTRAEPAAVLEPPAESHGGEEENRWRPISEYTDDGVVDGIDLFDLWLSVHASPLSMGMSDAWRQPDCFRSNGYWHDKEGALDEFYITHWMPVPSHPDPPPMVQGVRTEFNAVGLKTR